MTLQRAIPVEQLYRTVFKIMGFEGRFKASFGCPQLGNTWLVWGDTSNGKTGLLLQLSKYMSKFGKVLYLTYEEGTSNSFKQACERNKMHELPTGRFQYLPGESVADLTIRLKKRNAPDIIIIDSVQHARITKDEYIRLKHDFPNVLFIYVSHAKGKLPKGEVADFIMYDADLKVLVDRFRAFVKGRLNQDEGAYFDIFPEKSKILWQEVE